MSLVLILKLSQHVNKEIMNYSNSTAIREREVFWMVTRLPILWVLFLLDLILCKFKFFSIFRGLMPIIINFGFIADNSTFVFKEYDVLTYTVFAIYIFCYIFWAGQTIVYNWIIFGIAYILGYTFFTTIIIL